jgi:hypothetical protein
VIGLANDETGIPETPQQRLEIATKIVKVAGDYGIPPEDIVIDPLAMTVGAATDAVTITLETIRLIRENLGVNMSLGASNVSFGLPDRHALNAGVPADGDGGRADERDHEHGARRRRERPRRRPPARPRRVGRALDRRPPRAQGEGGRRRVNARPHLRPVGEPTTRGGPRRRAASACASSPTAPTCACRPARRSSTPASWNGIAIDSTCGGHGTCKKCKVRIVDGDVPVGRVDPRAFSPDELRAGLAPGVPRDGDDDLVVEVPPLQTRPKAALVGVGRHVILRPSVQKRYVELEEPSLEDQRSDVQRLLDAIEDLEPTVDLEVAKTLGRVLRDAHFKVTAVVCDEALVAIEPGDTTGRRYAIAFDLGTTTVVATLLDLETGTPAAVRSMLNRQQPYGADVISRVSATMLDDQALARCRRGRPRRSTSSPARCARRRASTPPTSTR